LSANWLWGGLGGIGGGGEREKEAAGGKMKKGWEKSNRTEGPLKGREKGERSTIPPLGENGPFPTYGFGTRLFKKRSLPQSLRME